MMMSSLSFLANSLNWSTALILNIQVEIEYTGTSKTRLSDSHVMIFAGVMQGFFIRFARIGHHRMKRCAADENVRTMYVLRASVRINRDGGNTTKVSLRYHTAKNKTRQTSSHAHAHLTNQIRYVCHLTLPNTIQDMSYINTVSKQRQMTTESIGKCLSSTFHQTRNKH